MDSTNSLLSPLVYSTFAVGNDSKFRMITFKKKLEYGKKHNSLL